MCFFANLPSRKGPVLFSHLNNPSDGRPLCPSYFQIGQMRSLSELLLDGLSLSYPDAKVCQDGTEAIMKFLCKGRPLPPFPPSNSPIGFRSPAADVVWLLQQLADIVWIIRCPS